SRPAVSTPATPTGPAAPWRPPARRAWPKAWPSTRRSPAPVTMCWRPSAAPPDLGRGTGRWTTAGPCGAVDAKRARPFRAAPLPSFPRRAGIGSTLTDPVVVVPAEVVVRQVDPHPRLQGVEAAVQIL